MFNLIDMLVVRPIVNILFVIYNFVGDFGLAIIFFVLLVKILTWPMMKRQIAQTRLMREIQPELAAIRKRCNGNKQMESLQMMELYKRKNVKPFRSMAMVFVQLPIFMALFTAINVSVRPCEVSSDYNVAVSRCAGTAEGKTIKYNVDHSAYPFVANLPKINEIIEQQHTYFNEVQEQGAENANYAFRPKLFGILDLSVDARQFITDIRNNKFDSVTSVSSIIILVFALCSAFAQLIMARQQDPTRKKGKKVRSMRELMKETAAGKDVSQEEINAASQRMTTMTMPFMMLIIMISLPGALVFYYLLNNIVTISLNKVVMSRSLTEMDAVADKQMMKELKAHEAVEAEIVREINSEESSKKTTKSHYGNKNKNSDSDNGVHITRISASNKKKRR